MKAASACLIAVATLIGRSAGAADVDISSSDIGGVVTGDHGGEAGVWVIAETRDLATRFAKIERAPGQFRSPPMQRASERADHCRRQAVPGRLDAVPVPGPAVQGRH
jgi:hypothetical protein